MVTVVLGLESHCIVTSPHLRLHHAFVRKENQAPVHPGGSTLFVIVLLLVFLLAIMSQPFLTNSSLIREFVHSFNSSIHSLSVRSLIYSNMHYTRYVPTFIPHLAHHSPTQPCANPTRTGSNRIGPARPGPTRTEPNRNRIGPNRTKWKRSCSIRIQPKLTLLNPSQPIPIQPNLT